MREHIRMSIYLRRLVRTAPIGSLQPYLDDVSPGTFDNLDWTWPRTELANALIEVLHALDEATRDRVFSDVLRPPDFGASATFVVPSRGVNPTGRDIYERAERHTGASRLARDFGEAADHVRAGVTESACQEGHVKVESTQPDKPARSNRVASSDRGHFSRLLDAL